ncbi:MAG: hypothetical protein R3F29_07130 [Planctomycetota bacterium]
MAASWALHAALAAQQHELLDLEQHPERTVRAGQPFRAELFGALMERPFRDRRHVDAWDLGFVNSPGIDGGATLPLASIYLWRHPDDGHLLRVLANGIDNDVFYAAAFDGEGGAEWVATFESFTWPGALGERVDGEVDEREELVWGYVRPGLGVGWREQVGPQQDNMFAADLIGEVGALYFGRGDQTSDPFTLPDSTLEFRARAKVRYDLLTHNIIELPHEGFAAGCDVVYGRRASWGDWGDPALVRQSGAGGRDYAQITAYAFGIAGAPWAGTEAQRLVAAVHVGAGDGVDRFSARRVGGGPDTRGGEFELTSRPVLPGASVGEYFPRRYALLYLGYRVELTWFAFLDLGVTTGPLDRDRATAAGRDRRDDWMTAASARLSSGFFGNARLQLLTAYGFDEVRNGDRGGWSVALQFSGYF